MKISIIGTGYVGLVTGTCFAETGLHVTCVDIDEQKINKLNSAVIPIHEPGLEEMVRKNIDKKRLFFTTNLRESLNEAEVVFIAVGTPPGEDGSADLTHVIEVARQIGQNMDHHLVVVTKSTVPIGTSVKVKKVIEDEIAKRDVATGFEIASNPEFLKEGNAIEDFLKPDRIVIGVDSEKARKVMERLYSPFVLNNHPILFMDIPSAELTKYAANAMLATKISFMNDIANLCELVGADINMVRKGIGTDNRIGNKFIYAGVGYGGSCFPKDVKALVKTAELLGHPLRLLLAVEAINQDQKMVMAKKIKAHFDNNLEGKQIAVWGLSFKPNTDDMREAPSLVIIKQLLQAGAKVKAYDPVANKEAMKILGNSIEYGNDLYDVLIGADALLLVTEWTEFRMPNFKVMEKLMRQKVIFDGRNIYNPSELQENGFCYHGIGRKIN